MCRLTPDAEKRRFYLKALAVSLATILIVGGGAEWFGKHYRFVVARQQQICLPGVHLALVNFDQRVPRRGEMFVFAVRGIAVTFNGRQYFEDGTRFMKIVAGEPGDVVEVGPEVTRVNGVPEGHGLKLLKTLHKTEKDIVRREIVPPGHYFFMGKTDDSYDGRYWGFVRADQILGKGYRIF